MLTGDEVKVARSLARMTQEQAAHAAGVTLRTWGNWERSAELGAGNEARVREVLGPYLPAGATPAPLADVSDAQLLAEIAARFDRGRLSGHGTATTRAGVSPAPAPPGNALDEAAEAVKGLLSDEAAEAVRQAERTMAASSERAKRRPR